MNASAAIKLFIALLLLVVVFHLCVLIKLIPYNIAWGGRLTNDAEMYVFESVSILINLFLIWVLLMKGAYLKFSFSTKTLTIILWIFFSLFVLNTIGNLFAKTNFEKTFSLLTAVSALLIGFILKKEKTTIS
ncbi:MAG: hypothetical protein IM600_17065 [Bacteroidetes bacterium]|nr:hypothetical protein [Bacteroidota bacterium]MCA6445142.1 hypothetical protein [Bacteroidota bacterium]